MIELSGIIESGNYSFAGHPTRPGAPDEISLLADTEIRGGNFVLARITKNGFNLTLTGGNCRGLRTRANPGDAWTKQDAYVWRRKRPLDQAAQIKLSILESAGTDGLAAWNFVVNLILNNPTIDQASWEAEQLAWAAKTGAYSSRPGKKNMVLPVIGLNRLIDSFWPGENFNFIKTLILTHSAETWAGDPTQILETVD